jgi:hypothetical protein
LPICPTPLCRDRGDRVIWCAAWPLYLNQHRKQKKRSEGFRPLESVEEARPKSYVGTATPVGWPWSDNLCYAASTRTAQTLLLALLSFSLVVRLSSLAACPAGAAKRPGGGHERGTGQARRSAVASLLTAYAVIVATILRYAIRLWVAERSCRQWMKALPGSDSTP